MKNFGRGPYLYIITTTFYIMSAKLTNTLLMLLLPNAGKYKRLLQGKGSQIQINNKTIIEFGSRRK